MHLLQIHEPGETPEPHASSAAIGIDLGTTHSVVAVMKDGAPYAVPNKDGHSIIPSIVAYANGVSVVGEAAGHIVGHIASVKRLMGRGRDEVEALAPHLQEYLIEGEGLPRLKMGGQARTAMEISSDILRYLKHVAEEALGEEVTDAVVTVPAYFDDSARLATRDAARLAGLNVLRLVNEPTAAALAYGLENSSEGIYAIYDLGGGTFDLSLLLLEKGVFQVLATAGDTALGGDDIDLALAMKHKLQTDKARQVKERLTFKAEVEGVSQADLAAIAKPFIERTLATCRSVLTDADLKPEELQGIVLVGGSTRMPAVREAVEAFFGRAPLSDADPDRVVAYGAAIQAQQLTEGGDHLLLDVIPLSLGLETMGDLVEKLIYRNTPIPATETQEFTTYQDGQTGLLIHVVQGEREMASQCRSLARFELKGIPPLPAGVARIKIVFQVDADGLLTVSAEETVTGIRQQVEVKPSYGLPFEEIERMILESMEHARADMTVRLLAEARVEAARLLHDTQAALDKDGDLLSVAEKTTLTEACGELGMAALTENRDAIDAASSRLQHVLGPFAQKRMDRAIGQALKGTRIDSIA